ncbi:unnamed protein product [Sphagnum tenellum]
MVMLEVELPEEKKTIEWDMMHPTFKQIKEKLELNGVPKTWFVEICRRKGYVSPDDNARLRNVKKLIIRASPILAKPNPSCTDQTSEDSKVLMGQKPDITDMFENVISYVGRVFVCTKDCKQGNITDVENCRGTVGLVGTGGESIGCWHTVEVALGQKGEGKYKVFIEYPNYGGPQSLMFEARIKDDLCSPELDLFVAEPVDPLKHKTTHLPCALDVSLADNVHCFGFLKVLDRKIIATYKNRKVVQGSEKCQVVEEPEIKRRLKLPAIFSGRVCFNGWKQAGADYLCFPNCSGGLVVDDWGCLKGIHVAAFRIGRKLRFHSLKVAKTKFKATQNFVHDSAGGDSDQNPLIVYQVAWNVKFKGMTFLTQSSLGVQSCDQQVYIL